MTMAQPRNFGAMRFGRCRNRYPETSKVTLFAPIDGFFVTNSALKKFGRSVGDLSSVASQPFNNAGPTKAARALDKHAAGAGNC